MNDSTCPKCDSPFSCGDEAEQHFLCGSWLEDGELFTSEACTIMANLRAECLRLRKERDDARNECEAAALRGEVRAVTSIVAWLRSGAYPRDLRPRFRGWNTDLIVGCFADAIERGEHEGSSDA